MKPSLLPLSFAAVIALLASSLAAGDEHPNWQSITYMSAWGPCARGENCGSVWLLDRAQQSIERKGLKAKASHKLSVQEWAQMEKLVSDARKQASTCPPPPTDVFEKLDIVESDGTKLSLEVTGCVFAQDANAVKTLAEWLERH